MRELIIKKCDKCSSIVSVIKNGSISCCGSEMRTLTPNSVDAAIEKHVPTYVVHDGLIDVTLNHVMDPDHYIEWILLLTGNGEEFIYFKPGDEPMHTFKYEPSSRIYAYCNKHELWVKNVE